MSYMRGLPDYCLGLGQICTALMAFFSVASN